MTARIPVILTGPAKIDGRFRQPGETVEVDPGRLPQLAQAGAIELGDDDQLPILLPGADGFEDAVAAMAKALADAAVAAAVEVATAELVADRDFLRREAENAEATLRSLQATNHQLELEIADLKASIDAGAAKGDAQTPDAAAEDPAPGKTSRKR